MNLRPFLKYLSRNYSNKILALAITMIIMGILEASSIFSLAPALDMVLNPDLKNISSVTEKIGELLKGLGISPSIWVFLTLFFALTLGSALIKILIVWFVARANSQIQSDLVIGTYKDLLSSNIGLFVSDKQGRLINCLLLEIPKVSAACVALSRLISDIIVLIASLTVSVYMSWKITLIAILGAALIVIPTLLTGRLMYRLGMRMRDHASLRSSTIQEGLSAIKVVLGYGNQEQSLRQLRQSQEQYCDALVKTSVLNETIPILLKPFALIVIVIAALTGTSLGINLTQAGVAVYAFARCIPYLSNIPRQRNVLLNRLPAFEQVQEIRDKASRIKQKTGTKIFSSMAKGIRVEGAVFSHLPGKPVLKNIDIEIPKGLMIGIVGESGSGKSTLLDVIMGFNEPEEGKVTIDRVDLYKYNITSLRKRIGYVPQESVLFNASVMENVIWAKPDATREEAMQACMLANAAEFVEELPEGIDTVIGDRGVKLSGGQCQRLSLARAIIRRPEILILDEATSALDSHSELLIQESINEIAKESTILVVAHRLSTVKTANKIYVMANGSIVEQGTFDELMTRKGHFNRLVQLQRLSEAG